MIMSVSIGTGYSWQKPNVELARRAGLQIGDTGAIARKLKAAAARRKGVSRLTLIGTKPESGGIILTRSICPKTTEALHLLHT